MQKRFQLKYLFLVGLMFVTSSLALPSKATVSPTKHQSLLTKAKDMDPKVFHYAMKAYSCAVKKGNTKSPYLTVVDYSKPSTIPRLWVFDLQRNRVKFRELVTHGSGSGTKHSVRFANTPNSHKSSIGVYKTGRIYQGKHGKSLNLHGLEPGYNDKAYSRRIVMHAASYVNPQIAKRLGRLGLSHGCFALDKKVNSKIVDTIKSGSVLVAYYPNKTWLKRSRYLNCG